jgi:hypothetical protein
MTRQTKYKTIYKKNRMKKIWFQDNQDAKGYKLNDNRVMDGVTRQEVVRRTFNI